MNLDSAQHLDPKPRYGIRDQQRFGKPRNQHANWSLEFARRRLHELQVIEHSALYSRLLASCRLVRNLPYRKRAAVPASPEIIDADVGRTP
jgi:hypothetical protein